MPIVTIDNKEYELDTLPEEVKQQLTNLTVCDQEITHLNVRLAIVQTARATYSHVLQDALSKIKSLS